MAGLKVLVYVGKLRFYGTVSSPHDRVLTLPNGMEMTIPPNARRRLAS